MNLERWSDVWYNVKFLRVQFLDLSWLGLRIERCIPIGLFTYVEDLGSTLLFYTTNKFLMLWNLKQYYEWRHKKMYKELFSSTSWPNMRNNIFWWVRKFSIELGFIDMNYLRKSLAHNHIFYSLSRKAKKLINY